MGINEVRLVDTFTKLVTIDSPSYGERKMGDVIKAYLRRLGMLVVEDGAGEAIGGDCGNIYGFLPGTNDASPLLFCTHLDTVEPSCGKKAVIADDGTITSAGDTVLGADDLSGVTAVLEALTAITEQKLPHRPVEVLFTVAEEVYCRGSAEFDFAKLLSAEAYVLDLAGPVGTAAYTAPSIIKFTATMHGKASHAGFAPEKGVHAIGAAADAINMLTMGRVDDETTVNIGIIEGGKATNVVPDACVVKGEVRSLDHQKAVAQVERVGRQFERSAAALGATVAFEAETVSKAYKTPLDHTVVGRFERVCNKLGLTSSLVQTFGGSDNNIIAEKGITGLVVANAMNRCHALDEFTTVDELVKTADITLALMTSAD